MKGTTVLHCRHPIFTKIFKRLLARARQAHKPTFTFLDLESGCCSRLLRMLSPFEQRSAVARTTGPQVATDHAEGGERVQHQTPALLDAAHLASGALRFVAGSELRAPLQLLLLGLSANEVLCQRSREKHNTQPQTANLGWE